MTINKPFGIEELVTYFENIKGYFIGDKKLISFIKMETGNHCLETILMKVAAISNTTLWQDGRQSIGSHILSLKIDDKLKIGDLGLVADICNCEAVHNPNELYQFASTYCCYHQPDLFPIYSIHGQRLANFFSPSNYYDIADHYESYAEIIHGIKTQLRLTSLNYIEINKFFWLYEGQLLSKGQASTVV